MADDSLLLDASIAHWERMVKFVRTLPPEGPFDSIEMMGILGETIGADDCPLCGAYGSGNDDNFCMSECPLVRAGACCLDYDSPYDRVKRLLCARGSNEEFVTVGEEMIAKLREVRKLYGNDTAGG